MPDGYLMHVHLMVNDKKRIESCALLAHDVWVPWPLYVHLCCRKWNHKTITKKGTDGTTRLLMAVN